MNCPYCGAELIYVDYYGKGSNPIKKIGDIYKCPYHEGFENLEDLLEFIDGDNLEEYLNFHNVKNWEDVLCDSHCHGGFFYTDINGNLNEGYPC